MALPIDTSRVVLLVGGVSPLADFETGEPKLDAEGRPEYRVDVMVCSSDRPAQLWPVKVPGQPKGVDVGQAVRFAELFATPWENNGRSGISFRAAGVTVVKPAAS